MPVACANCGAAVPEGAAFCPTCGAAVGTLPSVTEQRKIVTLLFADVTGSTALGDQLDPERLRALLGAYFGAMAAVIESWGGVVEKYIGDAILAVFGIPTVREDDAERALHAALEMGARLTDLNQQFERDHRVTLQVRIGVNSGEVVSPTGPAPEQRIVAGDAVNVAARLEQAAQPGAILVGERTRDAARLGFRFGDPVDLELKGKPAPVRAYPLLAAMVQAERGIPGLHAPMIGRNRELDTLLGLLDEAVETGRPRLVTIFGPAGIGKTRLTREFVAALRERYPEARVLRGRCLAAGHGITYWALGEILRGALGVGLDEPIDVVRERLRAGVAAILAPLQLPEADVDQTAMALAATIGISLTDVRGQRSITAEDLARAWPRFATAYAMPAPALWVIEDLHWAGEDLLEMLGHIATRTAGPVVILATARPEFAEAHPSFGGGGATSIALRPLTDGQSGELLTQLLTVAELGDELRAEILAKAEGNPFFVEEIIRRLIDEGILAREGDRWRATGSLPATSIPDSVYALVAARVDALPVLERRILQEAAVVGRTFWVAAVERAVGGEGLADALIGLERRGLLFVRPTSTLSGQAEYVFRHALVRDVAYASLPKARRARAHAEVADWMVNLAGERSDEFAELIAHHYLNAVRGEDADLAWLDDPDGREAIRGKAVTWLLAGGAVARRQFALARAVELHTAALELAASDAERLDAHEQLGRDHDVAYHGEDTLAEYQAALEIARRDPAAKPRVARLARRVASLVAIRGGAFHERPDLNTVEAVVAEGLDAADDPRERATLLIAFASMAAAWLSAGQPDPVPMERRMAAAHEAIKLADELDDPGVRWSAAYALRDLHLFTGDYAAAGAAIEAELPLLERIQVRTRAAQSYFEAAQALVLIKGDARMAEPLAERSRELAKDLSPHDQMHATSVLMLTGYRLGEWDSVEAMLGEHLDNLELESGVRCANVQGGSNNGALVLALRGNRDRALVVARRIPDFEHGPGTIEGSAAEVLVAAGEPEEGLRQAQRVLAEAPRWRQFEAASAAVHAYEALGSWRELGELAESVADLRAGSPPLDALVDRALGERLVANGDAAGGLALLRRAVERFDELPVVFEAARSREILADHVDPAEARSLLEAALATYERLGAAPAATRVRQRLEA
jgi:class 3 adenylate cyclase